MAKPIPAVFVPGDCNLDQPAFCETFEKDSPAGKGGALDERTWSLSRWGIPSSGGFRSFARAPASDVSHPNDFNLPILNTPTFCGKAFSNVLPPADLVLCDGVDGGGFSSRQLNEVFNDDTSFVFTSMRIRQPFDFTDRTGTIVFDVDAKRNVKFDGHGWWVELWLTADPTPMPYHGAPTVASYARRAIGFQMAPSGSDCFHLESPVCTQVGRVIVEKDYQIVQDKALEGAGNILTADGKLNRFKVLVSKDKVEFWASNFDTPGKLTQVAVANNLDLDFSVAYVHFQHAQYNAPKLQASSSQTYRWDNIAFDGPTYPTPRGYDVADQSEMLQSGDGVGSAMHLGYDIVPNGKPAVPVNVKVQGVDLTNASRATFNFNYNTKGNRTLNYRVNGHPFHAFVTPAQLGTDILMRTFSIPVPIDELATGENSIDLNMEGQEGSGESVGNIDITVEASQ